MYPLEHLCVHKGVRVPAFENHCFTNQKIAAASTFSPGGPGGPGMNKPCKNTKVLL